MNTTGSISVNQRGIVNAGQLFEKDFVSAKPEVKN